MRPRREWCYGIFTGEIRDRGPGPVISSVEHCCQASKSQTAVTTKPQSVQLPGLTARKRQAKPGTTWPEHWTGTLIRYARFATCLKDTSGCINPEHRQRMDTALLPSNRSDPRRATGLLPVSRGPTFKEISNFLFLPVREGRSRNRNVHIEVRFYSRFFYEHWYVAVPCLY